MLRCFGHKTAFLDTHYISAMVSKPQGSSPSIAGTGKGLEQWCKSALWSWATLLNKFHDVLLEFPASVVHFSISSVRLSTRNIHSACAVVAATLQGLYVARCQRLERTYVGGYTDDSTPIQSNNQLNSQKKLESYENDFKLDLCFMCLRCFVVWESSAFNPFSPPTIVVTYNLIDIKLINGFERIGRRPSVEPTFEEIDIPF